MKKESKDILFCIKDFFEQLMIRIVIPTLGVFCILGTGFIAFLMSL